jgi:hypothetical protein
VDSDLDPLIGVLPPSNTFVTDYPEMEGHTISARNLDKLFRVAHMRDTPSPTDLHTAILIICSEIGLLRYVSRRDALDFPISHTNKSKCISLFSRLPVIDRQRFVSAICQNTANCVHTPKTVERLMQNAREVFEATPIEHRIRGKDYYAVLNLSLRKLQIGIRETEPPLRATLHETDTLNRPRMRELANFLTQEPSLSFDASRDARGR